MVLPPLLVELPTVRLEVVADPSRRSLVRSVEGHVSPFTAARGTVAAGLPPALPSHPTRLDQAGGDTALILVRPLTDLDLEHLREDLTDLDERVRTLATEVLVDLVLPRVDGHPLRLFFLHTL